jgi:hypothetical protein
MTLTRAQEIYDALERAYLAVIAGNDYTITIGGTTRRFKRNDIEVIRKEMGYWENEIKGITNNNRGLNMKFGTSAR